MLVPGDVPCHPDSSECGDSDAGDNHRHGHNHKGGGVRGRAVDTGSAREARDFGSEPVAGAVCEEQATSDGQLRADGIILTYDPDGRTLRTSSQDAPSVTIGNDH